MKACQKQLWGFLCDFIEGDTAPAADIPSHGQVPGVLEKVTPQV